MFYVFLVSNNSFQIFENKIYDILFHFKTTKKHSDPIVIVSIDDTSLQVLKKKWPLSRQMFAQSLNQIASQSPALIALDFLFLDKGIEEDDKALSTALETIQIKIPVVLAMNFHTESSKENLNRETVTLFEKGINTPLFDADYGFINIPLDSDLKIRRAYLAKQYHEKIFLSFPLKIFQKYKNLKEKDFHYTSFLKLENSYLGSIRLDKRDSILISYEEDSYQFTRIPFFQVFNGEMPKDFFKDKIVLLGPYLTDVNDYYFTPVSEKKKMPGIEINAAVLKMLLEKNFYYSVSPFVNTVLFFLSVFLPLLFLFIKKKRLQFFLSVSFSLFAFYTFLVFLAFLIFQLIFILFLPLLSLALFTALLVVYRIWQDKENLKKEIQLLEETLSHPARKKNKQLEIPETFLLKYEISEREKEVLEHIIRGKANQSIADILFISISTVKKHINKIFQKTLSESREELVRKIRHFIQNEEPLEEK